MLKSANIDWLFFPTGHCSEFLAGWMCVCVCFLFVCVCVCVFSVCVKTHTISQGYRCSRHFSQHRGLLTPRGPGHLQDQSVCTSSFPSK